MLNNPRIIVFLGLGSGEELFEYIKNPHPLNLMILLFEKEPQHLNRIKGQKRLEPLFKSDRVQTLVGTSIPDLKKQLHHFFLNSPALFFSKAIEYIALDPLENYAFAKKIMDEAIYFHRNGVISDPYDAFRGASHTLQNLEVLLTLPEIHQAHGIFHGKAGLVIGSGPSLSKSLDILKEIQGRVVMAACPSAIPLLLNHGINPDLHVNIERDSYPMKIITQTRQNSPHLFVGIPVVHPRCFSETNSFKTYCLGSNLLSDWLPFKSPKVVTGQSAANMAFSLLSLLGCSEIYLLGQDLCYADDGDSHTAGIDYQSKVFFINEKMTGRRQVMIEGNNGQEVRTHPFWHAYLKTFTEDLIPNYSGKVFNVMPRGYGAKLHGSLTIEPLMLKELLQDKVPWDPYHEIVSCLKKPSLEDQEKNRSILKEKIKSAKEMLQWLIKRNQSFALYCKETTFDPILLNKNQELIKGFWDDFLKKYYLFQNDLSEVSSLGLQERELSKSYREFFYPVVQGLTVKTKIDLFSSSQDLDGNCAQINRKLDLIFNMLKDESYWAEMMADLIEKHLKNYL